MRPAQHHRNQQWAPEPYYQQWGRDYREHRDNRYHRSDHHEHSHHDRQWQPTFPRPFAVQAQEPRWRPQQAYPARHRYAPYASQRQPSGPNSARWRGSDRHLRPMAGQPQDVLASGLTCDQAWKLMSREITADDYDLLLSLDEHNVRSTCKDVKLVCVAAGDRACSVCISGFDDGRAAKLECCEAVFHAECIRKWLGEYKNKCPNCRHEHER